MHKSGIMICTSRWKSPKCCACQEDAIHLSKTFCACHTDILPNIENVTKCHPCNIKQHWNQWNLRKRRLWSFSHRQGDATKPENRDGTCRSINENTCVVRDALTSSNLDTWFSLWFQNRCFPILSWTPKSATSTPTWATGYLASSLITSQKPPCLPRNLHLLTTSCSPDSAIRAKHATHRNIIYLK